MTFSLPPSEIDSHSVVLVPLEVDYSLLRQVPLDSPESQEDSVSAERLASPISAFSIGRIPPQHIEDATPLEVP